MCRPSRSHSLSDDKLSHLGYWGTLENYVVLRALFPHQGPDMNTPVFPGTSISRSLFQQLERLSLQKSKVSKQNHYTHGSSERVWGSRPIEIPESQPSVLTWYHSYKRVQEASASNDTQENVPGLMRFRELILSDTSLADSWSIINQKSRADL